MIGRALMGLALVSAVMFASGGDPFAVAALAALSLTVLALPWCLNRGGRLAGPTAGLFGGLRVSYWVEQLFPIDHDCPVVLTVIRR